MQKYLYFRYILCMDDMMYVKRLTATMLEEKVPDQVKKSNFFGCLPCLACTAKTLFETNVLRNCAALILTPTIMVSVSDLYIPTVDLPI